MSAVITDLKRPNGLAFSPDGKTLANGGWKRLGNGKSNGDLQTWEVSTGRRLRVLARPRAAVIVSVVRFSSDERLLAAMVDDEGAVVETWQVR